ncbi:MAG: 2-oxoacid:acceptor oxidoreductase family protein [Bacillota bacterium]|nr:2-oxoacid:acceptor oxidoreductase family protein [Bacillota bacterium]
MNYQIQLTGSGGQGLILAGIILAEAAIRQGKNSVQTQSYGPEARGGSSKAEVIISDDEIDFPKVDRSDFCIAMTQEACDKYAEILKEDGVLIVDSTYVYNTSHVKAKVYSLPITQMAKEKLGKEVVANMVALGVFIGITHLVSNEIVEKTMLGKVPESTHSLNQQALALGLMAAQQVLGRRTTNVRS